MCRLYKLRDQQKMSGFAWREQTGFNLRADGPVFLLVFILQFFCLLFRPDFFIVFLFVVVVVVVQFAQLPICAGWV